MPKRIYGTARKAMVQRPVLLGRSKTLGLQCGEDHWSFTAFFRFGFRTAPVLPQLLLAERSSFPHNDSQIAPHSSSSSSSLRKRSPLFLLVFRFIELSCQIDNQPITCVFGGAWVICSWGKRNRRITSQTSSLLCCVLCFFTRVLLRTTSARCLRRVFLSACSFQLRRFLETLLSPSLSFLSCWKGGSGGNSPFLCLVAFFCFLSFCLACFESRSVVRFSGFFSQLGLVLFWVFSGKVFSPLVPLWLHNALSSAVFAVRCLPFLKMLDVFVL